MASLTFISGLLLVSSIGLVVMEAGAGDKQLYFPEFVQNKQASQYWRSAWGTDEAYVEWRFNGAQLKKATYSSTSFISQTWNCTSMDNDTYVTRLTDDNSTATMHLGFKKLTDNVVRTTCASTDAMCEENSTLLIANEPRSKKTLGSCNIHKGSSSFLPKVFNNGSYNQLCDAQPSILTSECMPGEGMRLEFASLTCLPSGFGLPTDVTLHCLESWEDRNSTVSLLGTSFYDPTHCMVFSSTNSNFVRIIPGWSCPTGDEEGMLKLELTTLGLENDIVTGCDVELCHRITNYNRICPKTCNLNAGNDTDATFVGVIGTWGDGEPGGINVEITDDSLKVDGFANFKAIKNVSANTYVISPTNLPSSCLPRVSCIRLETPSKSMLRYKISQSMAVTSSSADVCSENNFVNDDAPLGSKYRSRFMKNLVAIPYRTAGPCGYTGHFILHAEKCNGSLVANRSEFSVKLDCVSENTTTTYSCLANFQLKAFGSSLYRAVVTKNSTGSHQCWIWNDDQGGSPRQVYQLSGIDCNQETVEGILSGKLSERIKIRAYVTTDETMPTTTSATDTTAQPLESEPTDKATPTTQPGPGLTSPNTGLDSTTTEENETASGVSGGVVAGAVFGVLIGLVLLGVVGFYGYRYIAARRMPYRVL